MEWELLLEETEELSSFAPPVSSCECPSVAPVAVAGVLAGSLLVWLLQAAFGQRAPRRAVDARTVPQDGRAHAACKGAAAHSAFCSGEFGTQHQPSSITAPASADPQQPSDAGAAQLSASAPDEGASRSSGQLAPKPASSHASVHLGPTKQSTQLTRVGDDASDATSSSSSHASLHSSAVQAMQQCRAALQRAHYHGRTRSGDCAAILASILDDSPRNWRPDDFHFVAECRAKLALYQPPSSRPLISQLDEHLGLMRGVMDLDMAHHTTSLRSEKRAGSVAQQRLLATQVPSSTELRAMTYIKCPATVLCSIACITDSLLNHTAAATRAPLLCRARPRGRWACWPRSSRACLRGACACSSGASGGAHSPRSARRRASCTR